MRIRTVELECETVDGVAAWATVRLTGYWHAASWTSPEDGPDVEVLSVVRDDDLRPIPVGSLDDETIGRLCRQAEEHDREQPDRDGPEEP